MGREKRSRAISIYIYIFFGFFIGIPSRASAGEGGIEWSGSRAPGVSEGPYCHQHCLNFRPFEVHLHRYLPNTFLKDLFESTHGVMKIHRLLKSLNAKWSATISLTKQALLKITALKSQRQPRTEPACVALSCLKVKLA